MSEGLTLIELLILICMAASVAVGLRVIMAYIAR